MLWDGIFHSIIGYRPTRLTSRPIFDLQPRCISRSAHSHAQILSPSGAFNVYVVWYTVIIIYYIYKCSLYVGVQGRHRTGYIRHTQREWSFATEKADVSGSIIHDTGTIHSDCLNRPILFSR